MLKRFAFYLNQIERNPRHSRHSAGCVLRLIRRARTTAQRLKPALRTATAEHRVKNSSATRTTGQTSPDHRRVAVAGRAGNGVGFGRLDGQRNAQAVRILTQSPTASLCWGVSLLDWTRVKSRRIKGHSIFGDKVLPVRSIRSGSSGGAHDLGQTSSASLFKAELQRPGTRQNRADWRT